jgi:hypothetical protein
MMYAPGSGAGQPPMNCNICGSRVPRLLCERHSRERGWIALRDKYLGLFVVRAIPHIPEDTAR